MGISQYHTRPRVRGFRCPFGLSIRITLPMMSPCAQTSSPLRFPSPCNMYFSPSTRTNRCNTYVRLPQSVSTSANKTSPLRGVRTTGAKITLSLSPSINGLMLTPDGVKRTSFPSLSSRANSGINMSLATFTVTG